MKMSVILNGVARDVTSLTHAELKYISDLSATNAELSAKYDCMRKKRTNRGCMMSKILFQICVVSALCDLA